jgi:hypothetical protein
MGENLRDLVPAEEVKAVARGPRFKSPLNPKAVPTYSTFVKSPPSEVPKSEWLGGEAGALAGRRRFSRARTPARSSLSVTLLVVLD